MRIQVLIIVLMTSNLIFGQFVNSEIEKHSATVAYVYTEKIENLTKNGEIFEIWLKNKQTGELKPSIIPNTGSGFFIHAEDRYSTYFVTAAHVAIQTNDQTILVVAGNNNKPYKVKLTDIAFKKEIRWVYSDYSDVAVLPLDPQYLIDNSLNIRSMSTSFLEIDYIPNRTREVTCIGFPLSMGFNHIFSPITKSSKPSSGLIELLNQEKNRYEEFFLLDDPSTPGFSGSPVFEFPNQIYDKDKIILSNKTSIVGLVHGYVSSNNTMNSGGFAAIVPAKFISYTLNKAPKFTGRLKYKFDNGNPWSEIEIENGMPLEILYNLDKNGNKMEKGSYKNGNGTINMYLENGKLHEIRTYENGKIVKYN